MSDLVDNFPPETASAPVGIPVRFRQDALDNFYRAKLDAPFSWGTNDCAMFAADWYAMCTGTDPAASFRGYSTESEAQALIASYGGLRQLAEAVLGEPISGLFAEVGNVVLINLDGRLALGICNGSSTLGPGTTGITNVVAPVICAWRIPDA